MSSQGMLVPREKLHMHRPLKHNNVLISVGNYRSVCDGYLEVTASSYYLNPLASSPNLPNVNLHSSNLYTAPSHHRPPGAPSMPSNTNTVSITDVSKPRTLRCLSWFRASSPPSVKGGWSEAWLCRHNRRFDPQRLRQETVNFSQLS